MAEELKTPLSQKWPSCCQWKKLPKVLKKKERIALLIFLVLFFAAGIFLLSSFYLENTKIQPKFGGNYIEGAIGQPRFINPIYASTNDADRDLVELIFSGLVKYDEEGKIIPDLAKNFEIKDEGKTYEFYLRDDVFWHDGEKLTSEDVIFTIKTIQNPDYKSPSRANWLGVEAEEISASEGLSGVRLKLKIPYASFLENCTVKILPKHIWQDVPPENFPLTIYNLEPVGTGPFKFKSFRQDKLGYIKSYTLIANRRYFEEGPFLSEITFSYFKDEKEALKSLKNGEINGLSSVSAESSGEIKENSLNLHHLSLPRYFAVFLNSQKSKILQENEVRQALNYGTNRQDIVDKVLFGQGKIASSPILPDIFGFEEPENLYEFNPEKAKEILEKAGFTDNDGDGFREKTVKKASVFQFKSDLKKGSQGTEVKKLQECLSKDPEIYPGGSADRNFWRRNSKSRH